MGQGQVEEVRGLRPLTIVLAALLLATVVTWTLLATPLGPLLGICPGPVPVPTPRYDYDWPVFAGLLAKEVAQADMREQGFDLVWYGDSITENLRGTSVGHPWPGGVGAHDVYLKYFGKYSSDILAVAGDQVGHLWWRLLHGELPQINYPAVAVLLIGTNDLTAADCTKNEEALLAVADATAARVQEVLTLMRHMAGTHILVQAVLPRGSSFDGDERYVWPNRFTKALAIINDHVQMLASGDRFLHYVDCGGVFLTDKGIDPALMPDGIHPFAEGLTRQLACLQPFVDDLMANASRRGVKEPSQQMY